MCTQREAINAKRLTRDYQRVQSEALKKRAYFFCEDRTGPVIGGTQYASGKSHPEKNILARLATRHTSRLKALLAPRVIVNYCLRFLDPSVYLYDALNPQTEAMLYGDVGRTMPLPSDQTRHS